MRSMIPVLPRTLGLASLIGLAWALFALAFALLGYGVAVYRGIPQPWWPSFGYALAIFSVWAAMTPLIARSVRWTSRLATLPRWLALGAGLPVASALHVILFALVFWPIYNGDGRIPTRLAMAELMAFRNLDTDALLYLLLVGGTLWWDVGHRRPQAPSGSEPAPVRVSSRGQLRLIPPAEIDWISAAGDYVELHARGGVHLVEGSLVGAHNSTFVPRAKFLERGI